MASQCLNARLPRLCAVLSAIFLVTVPLAAAVAGPFKDGEEAYRAGNYAKAMELYRKAADKGSAEAQVKLGNIYYEGRGVNQDYAEAARLYQNAAKQGNAKAQANLALIYYHGLGTAPDYAEAATWFRKAADQGYGWAQNRLGDLYYKGQGVPQDYAQAVKWFQKAADDGTDEAQVNLGTMYYRGQGVPQDYAEAMKWFQKAADQGNAVGQLNLGIMYDQGQGVPQSYSEAIKWYRTAADQGNDEAQYAVGSMYQEGNGVQQDDAEALQWFRIAAEKGNGKAYQSIFTAALDGDAKAQLALGLIFQHGRGTRQNYDEAYRWFKLAAANPSLNKEDLAEAIQGRDAVANILVRRQRESRRNPPQVSQTPVSPTIGYGTKNRGPQSTADVDLVSSDASKSNGLIRINGELRNIGNKPISNLMIVVSHYTKDGTLVRTDTELIGRNPILPGQTIPFTTIGKDNPDFTSYKINFERQLGGTVGLGGSSTQIVRPPGAN